MDTPNNAPAASTPAASPAPASPAPAVAPGAAFDDVSLSDAEQLEALRAARQAKQERIDKQREPAREQPPAEQPEREDEERQQTSSAPHELKVPEWIDDKAIGESHKTWLSDFAKVAPTSGIDARTAQSILDIAADGAVHIGNHGIEVEHSTAEEGQAAMERIFGQETANALIANAQRYVRSHGGKDGPLSRWLSETGLGNAPEILTALAFASSSYFEMTPERAQAQIDALMQTPEFRRGDRLTILKIQAASRIANRDALSPESQLDDFALRSHEPGQKEVEKEEEKKNVKQAKEKLGKLITDKFKSGFSPADREEFMKLAKRMAGS